MTKRVASEIALLSASLALFVAACGTSGAPAIRTEPTPTLSELVAEYIRAGFGPRGTEVDITYAPEAFFLATGQPVPAGVRTRRELVFIYNESVHDGELPRSAPVVLIDAAGRRGTPTSASVVTEGGHHRSTRLVFAHDGSPARSLTLLVLADDGTPAPGGELSWRLGDAGTTSQPAARGQR